MNRHVFRTVTRARAGGPSLCELDTATLSPYFLQTQTASFGTTSIYCADSSSSNGNPPSGAKPPQNDGNPFDVSNNAPKRPFYNNSSTPRPNLRERAALSRSAVQDAVTRGQKVSGEQRAAVIRNPAVRAQLDGKTPTAPGDRSPRIVDVKNLPAGGLRGRGSRFRGRGGARGEQTDAAFMRDQVKFSRTTEGGVKVRGWGNRGATRGGAKRGGTGRGGAAKKKRRPDDENFDGKNKKRGINPLDVQEPDQKEFEDAVRFGTDTLYTPKLDMEDLKVHLPNVPGQVGANIHASLATLGTSDHVGLSAELTPQMFAKDLRKDGLRYFADLEEKDRTDKFLRRKDPFRKNPKGTPAIQDAEDAVKQAVYDTAVVGKVEMPKYTEKGQDAVQVSRNWHLRSETWGPKESRLFEEKLMGLLAKGKKVPKKGEAKAKA